MLNIVEQLPHTQRKIYFEDTRVRFHKSEGSTWIDYKKFIIEFSKKTKRLHYIGLTVYIHN